ncbi:hypothetical protein RclHR1_05610007 [Rhizophagus clarus]|uniref:Phosphatidylglycerol/phosphatidylinositol transfer protein n=1 Tax=Rhizophagus clarus TaxID=94130 RepID=A0A2Z6S5A4_9GLOM|nr:hypothetical protein RclHR1_05610007 [Rhizophagus clarus]
MFGQETTVCIAGKATVAIENGALNKIIRFYGKKQIYHYDVNFCEEIAAPSGFTCLVKDNFDFTPHFTIKPEPNDPKNTIEENGIKILIANPVGKYLSCIEGNIKFSYP